MARSAVLNVQVLVDAAKAAGELNQTAAKFESWGKKLGNALIGAVAIKGVTELAKSVVSSASQMEQAMGGTDKVFGSSASDIHKWAADTTDAIRLPAAAVEKYAVLIKTQLAATGQPMGVLVNQTKALIQVGADLAAVTGADLADSIAAVKSALAGEYDPIQNLGVAMTAATVNTKALALAHGDAALAATTSIQAQARVAEIMEKSAFATGAAAEESNTFQAKVDSLKEQLSTLAVAIGGPMLDSLAGMVGGMSDAASSASTLGVGLGTMVGSILSLPGPIQAVVIGLLALVAVSAKWGAAVTKGLTEMVSSFKTATSSASGFKAAMSGIGSALAGGALLLGVGAVIAAIAIAIGRVTEAANKGKAALAGYVTALVESGNKATDSTAKAFKEAVLASDAFAELVKDGFTANEAVGILTGTMENWHDVMSGSLGGGIRNLNRDTMSLVDGFIDANGAAGGLAQAQIDGANALGLTTDGAGNATTALDGYSQAAADAEATTKRMGEELKKIQGYFKAAFENSAASRMMDDLDIVGKKAERASEVIHAALDKAWPDQRNQLRDNGISNLVTQVQGAGKLIADEDIGGKVRDIFLDIENMDPIKLAFLGEPGQQVKEWSNGFQSEWDNALVEIFKDAGGNVDSTVQAMLGHTESMVGGLAEQLHIPVDEARQIITASIGDINAETLTDKVLKMTAEDQELYEKTLFYESIQFDPVTQVFKSDIQIPEVAAIVAQLNSKYGLVPPTPVGVTPQIKEPDAIQKLVGNAVSAAGTLPGPPVQPTVDQAPVTSALGAIAATNTPTKVTATAETAGADAQINAVADGKRDAAIEVGANTTIAQGAISALIADARNRTAMINVDANVAPANGQINAVANAKRITTVDVMANPNMAVSTITALTSAQRSTTIIVNANATQALQTIGNVVNSHYAANVTVGADTGPARSAISAVTNGSYTATIVVTANVSQAQAAIAAIPRSVSVTAPAPAPPPAPAMRSFGAAPTLAQAPMMSRSATSNITINVSGALDPVAAGRQIETVMRRYDRRRSGITPNSSVLRSSGVR